MSSLMVPIMHTISVKLVTEHGIKPSMMDLQKIVSCQKKEAIDTKYREENDDWYFDKVPSVVKQHAVKQFVAAFKIHGKEERLKEKALSNAKQKYVKWRLLH